MGSRDRSFARMLWTMCARDILFWVNTFCVTLDPRKNPSLLPFITYPFQDTVILTVQDAIDTGYDLGQDKSRDMGATWMCLLPMQHQWQFRPNSVFLVVSRKEEYVDKGGDHKTLFAKLDMILKYQPGWLIPAFTRNKLHLHNDDNGSTIDGESTTGDVGRGSRPRGILLDEFASVERGYEVLAATADATNCRIFNSTPKGVGNAFYDLMHSDDLAKLHLHWTLHPEKAAGYYVDDQGKAHSDWYDRECKRRSHPMEIAQELDIDYLGSDHQFFDQDVLERLRNKNVRSPYHRGEIDFEYHSCKPMGFEERHGGRLRLWLNVDRNGSVPSDRSYVVGVDVATGSRDVTGKGASNSCISIGDATTAEKVGEFVANGVPPTDLARIAVAICRWFMGADGNGAFLIWEANGPGQLFGDTVMDLGYRNIYYRTKEDSLSKKQSDTPGWWSTRTTKLSLLGEYRRALQSGLFVNRSSDSLKECSMYVYGKAGEVAHSKSIHTENPTEGRDNHGDRVIADALCWKAMRSEKTPESEEIVPNQHTFAARRNEYLKAQKSETHW